jgi:catechol 2,3-dioxygenase-like lactoylglutathione lyase family enzyme
VHHVSINVDDVDKALDFYVGTLGLVPRPDRPDFGFPGAWLNAGDQQVH